MNKTWLLTGGPAGPAAPSLPRAPCGNTRCIRNIINFKFNIGTT